MALTDKKAIKIALWIAIDTEESLIDAHTNHFTGVVDEEEKGVKGARANIAAFKRVLDRYYGGAELPRIKAGKPLSLAQLMRGGAE